VRRLRQILSTLAARSRARRAGLAPGVEIGARVRFGRGVSCTAAPNGRVVLGDDVEVGATTSLTAMSGATLEIGDSVFISGGCTIAAAQRLRIGRESMIAELVSIRDHDHDPAHPPRSGHSLKSDLDIGERVWLGAKATVVRGGSIGDDAVIGAHGLVNRPVPASALAVGVPARVVRDLA
jgi:acetyltransferase-like isoleucine patch superfamily enzyme